MIRPHGFETLAVWLALHLRGTVSSVLHHAPHRMHAHLDAVAPKLIADLTRSESRVAAPLRDDLLISLRLYFARRRTAGGCRSAAFSRLLQLAAPLVDREAAAPYLVAATETPRALAYSRISARCDGVYRFATCPRPRTSGETALVDGRLGSASTPFSFAALHQRLTQLCGIPCLRAAAHTPTRSVSRTAARR